MSEVSGILHDSKTDWMLIYYYQYVRLNIPDESIIYTDEHERQVETIERVMVTTGTIGEVEEEIEVIEIEVDDD